MGVRFTPDQQAFIREAIESGRLQRPEDAIEEALSLWEERERRRLEILATIDKAEASLASADDVKARQSDQSVSEMIREIVGEVPPDELAKLPPDSASQVDHYVYGLPKRY